MKLQNLAIIFIVIMIPLILILSYYINLQHKTLKLQGEYDIKLAEATKEGIKAFEINTGEWGNNKDYNKKESNRENVSAMINAFISSLANNINISGTAKEFMSNYIPAVTATMYDGYYIYAPSKVPEAKLTYDGLNLFYDAETGQAVSGDGTGKLPILYEAESGGETYTYSEGGTIKNATIDINNAKKVIKHDLGAKINYTAQYTKGTDTNVIVNYTLDNRINVYGKVSGEGSVSRQGYLVYFDFPNTALPLITRKLGVTTPNTENDLDYMEKVSNTKYNNTTIESEILEEQIVYQDEDDENKLKLGTFIYIYDIEHVKLYYNPEKNDGYGDFFMLTKDKERIYINDDPSEQTAPVGDPLCRYKSISVLWGDSGTTQDKAIEYKKIYQVLNGKDKGKWYINLSGARKSSGEEILEEEINTKKAALGLTDVKIKPIYRDFSAISYYVEACAFTNWVRTRLNETLTCINLVKVDDTTGATYVASETIDNLFDINVDNDPEKETSKIVEHKKEIMKNSIITNLNRAITNYGNNKEANDFYIPVIKDADWEQLFSNISLITFFQGVPIGLKTYNDYAIATSNTNREFVDPGEIYFTRDIDKDEHITEKDENYHRVFCKECKNIDYTGYRSVEYLMNEFEFIVATDTGTEAKSIYYYTHDNQGDNNSEKACYYCVVNKSNYERINGEETASDEEKEKNYRQSKSYYEALARERYYQFEEVVINLRDILSISEMDVIFILDASGSMKDEKGRKLLDTYEHILELIYNSSTDYYLNTIIFKGEEKDYNERLHEVYVNDQTEVIGDLATQTLSSYITKLEAKYSTAGNTFYSLGFKAAEEAIDADLASSTRKRFIVFLTDGEPSVKGNNGWYMTWTGNGGMQAIYRRGTGEEWRDPGYMSYVNTLKTEKKVDMILAIYYYSDIDEIHELIEYETTSRMDILAEITGDRLLCFDAGEDNLLDVFMEVLMTAIKSD